MSVSPNTNLHFNTFRIFRMHASKYISLGLAAIPGTGRYKRQVEKIWQKLTYEIKKNKNWYFAIEIKS